MDRAYQFQRFDTGIRNLSNRIGWYLIEKQIEICEDKNIDTMFMSFSTFQRINTYQKVIVNRINKKLNLIPDLLHNHIFIMFVDKLKILIVKMGVGKVLQYITRIKTSLWSYLTEKLYKYVYIGRD